MRRTVFPACAMFFAACAKFSGEDNGAPDAQAPFDASSESAAPEGGDGAPPPNGDAGDGGNPIVLKPFTCPTNVNAFFCDEFEREDPSGPRYTVQGNSGFKINVSTSTNAPRTGQKSFLAEVLANNGDGEFRALRYVPTTTAGATSFEMRFSMRAPKMPQGRVDVVAVDFPTNTGSEQTVGVRMDGNTLMLWRYGRSGAAVQPITATAPFVFDTWHDYVLVVGTNRSELKEVGGADLSLEHGVFTVIPAAVRIDVGVAFALTQTKGFNVYFDDLVLPN